MYIGIFMAEVKMNVGGQMQSIFLNSSSIENA